MFYWPKAQNTPFRLGQVGPKSSVDRRVGRGQGTLDAGMGGTSPSPYSVSTITDESGTRRRLWSALIILLAISSVLMLHAASARASAECPAGGGL
jgi:hypothetical protein